MKNTSVWSLAVLIAWPGTTAAFDQYRVIDTGIYFWPQGIGQGGVTAGDWGADESYAFSEQMGLVPIPGFTYPRPRVTDVNSRGEVVGYDFHYEIGGAAYRDSLVWDCQNGTTSLTGYPHNYQANEAYGINDNGDVAGRCWDRDGLETAFLWRDGAESWSVLSPLEPGWSAMAIGINNRGEVYGGSAHLNDRANVLWRADGSIVEIPVPFGQHQASHNDINDLGYLCGFAWGYTASAFIRRPDGSYVRIMNPLEYGWYITAQGINNQNAVVGCMYDSDRNFRAWVWSETGAVALLDDLLVGEDQGWRITSATGINDAGTICAVASLNGVERAVLLQPVPEPATVAALALGLAALASRRRRR